jgi:hypothetical protein
LNYMRRQTTFFFLALILSGSSLEVSAAIEVANQGILDYITVLGQTTVKATGTSRFTKFSSNNIGDLWSISTDLRDDTVSPAYGLQSCHPTATLITGANQTLSCTTPSHVAICSPYRLYDAYVFSVVNDDQSGTELTQKQGSFNRSHCPTCPSTCNNASCYGPADFCSYLSGCDEPPSQTVSDGCCCQASPVIIDVSGNGYRMTDASNGVLFDLGGDGRPDQISWTEAGTDDAWLMLDRNGNGTVDSGLELFGNLTPQPKRPNCNGFLALAEFDKAESGGNADGAIDARDAVFESLRLWQDANHNGVSEAGELKTLTSLGLTAIDLEFTEARRRDQYGNLFSYRARTYDDRGFHVGKWAYDVFLLTPSGQARAPQ